MKTKRRKQVMAREVKKAEKAKGEVVPWRPFSEMARWEHDIDPMFENFLARRMRPFWRERWWPASGLEITTPTVDLYEEKDDIVVKALIRAITSGWRRARSPIRKKVALASCRRSISSTSGVKVGCGPSSKERPTKWRLVRTR